MPSLWLVAAETAVIVGAVSAFRGRSKLGALDAVGLAALLLVGVLAVQWAVPVLEAGIAEARESGTPTLALAEEPTPPPASRPDPAPEAKADSPPEAPKAATPTDHDLKIKSKRAVDEPVLTPGPRPIPPIDEPEDVESTRKAARPVLDPIEDESSAKARMALAVAANKRGLDAFRAGKYREAVAAFDEALARDPNNPRALHNRGQAHYKLGEVQRALRDFSNALDRGDEVNSRISRSVVNFELKSYDAVIADTSAVIGSDPSNALAYRLRGRAYKAKGDADRGEADLKRAEESSKKAK